MQIIDRILSLRKLDTFRYTSDRELILLAETMGARHFSPAQVILEKGKIGEQLYVVIEGSTQVGSFSSSEELLGLESIILGIPHRHTWAAGPEGADCLTLDRAYVFTLVHECPSILLTSMGEQLGMAK